MREKYYVATMDYISAEYNTLQEAKRHCYWHFDTRKKPVFKGDRNGVLTYIPSREQKEEGGHEYYIGTREALLKGQFDEILKEWEESEKEEKEAYQKYKEEKQGYTPEQSIAMCVTRYVVATLQQAKLKKVLEKLSRQELMKYAHRIGCDFSRKMHNGALIQEIIDFEINQMDYSEQLDSYGIKQELIDKEIAVLMEDK